MEGWEYVPGEVTARVVKGDNGRDKIQLRVDRHDAVLQEGRRNRELRSLHYKVDAPLGDNTGPLGQRLRHLRRVPKRGRGESLTPFF